MNLLLGAIVLLFIWIFIYMYRYRLFIAKYTGTTAALASGMMIGFLSSASFSINTEVHDDSSTVLGLIISMLAGMMIGAPHSFSAWAAGACGGLVSAPLGKIVVSLISAERAESFITALLVLCIIFILVLLGMMTAEIPYYYALTFRKLVLNPFTIGLPLIFIFYLYELLERGMFSQRSFLRSKKIESHHGSKYI
ncbi:MAG TPA: hypothetical protein VNM45_10840 [Bacillus sp. (in: firmicutes)]|nr:hypothetical protein [Bacillus sp. (in: firmicutes)]